MSSFDPTEHPRAADGQFAPTAHADGDVELGAPFDPGAPVHAWDREPDEWATRQDGITRINDPLAPTVVTRDGRVRVVFALRPDPVVAVEGSLLVGALRADRPTGGGSLVDGEHKGTYLVGDEATGVVSVYEGRMRVDPDGSLTFRPKGTRRTVGVRSTATILGATPGYGGTDALIDEAREAGRDVPRLAPATPAGIPDDEHEDGRIHAVYALNHPGIAGYPATRTPGCAFMATSVTPDGDDPIVNGYLSVPEGAQLVSEHGSFRASELARMGGRLADYEPGTMTYAQAWETEGRPWRAFAR